MNALQSFIASKPCGFLKDTDIPALIALDRLCPVLVRCGGCRFTCSAQDIAHIIRCIEAGGDYVRDVSFPVGSLELAARWQPEPNAPRPFTHEERKADLAKRKVIHAPFDESQCGGVYDGFSVSSDADPGL
jgi:hypothetical protein